MDEEGSGDTDCDILSDEGDEGERANVTEGGSDDTYLEVGQVVKTLHGMKKKNYELNNRGAEISSKLNAIMVEFRKLFGEKKGLRAQINGMLIRLQ